MRCVLESEAYTKSRVVSGCVLLAGTFPVCHPNFVPTMVRHVNTAQSPLDGSSSKNYTAN